MLECDHDIYPLSFGFAELLRSFFFLVFTVFVDTVGDMLVDLTQSDLYFVERFLARDIFSSC